MRQVFRKAMPINGVGALLVASLVVALAVLTVARAVTSAQNPPRATVASGGTVAAQSATHRVSGTVGQIAAGRPQSATNSVAEGFWNTLGICECPHIGDLDTNGFLNILDVVGLVNVAFRGAEMPPSDRFCPLATRADLNCNGIVNIQDVVSIVNAAFRGSDTRCNPCAPTP